MAAGPATSTVRNIKGADYQIIARSSDYTGWKTIGVFPLNQIMRQVGQSATTPYHRGVTVVFAFLMSLFFTGSIAQPVIKLRALMKEAEEGNLRQVRRPPGRRDRPPG